MITHCRFLCFWFATNHTLCVCLVAFLSHSLGRFERRKNFKMMSLALYSQLVFSQMVSVAVWQSVRQSVSQTCDAWQICLCRRDLNWCRSGYWEASLMVNAAELPCDCCTLFSVLFYSRPWSRHRRRAVPDPVSVTVTDDTLCLPLLPVAVCPDPQQSSNSIPHLCAFILSNRAVFWEEKREKNRYVISNCLHRSRKRRKGGKVNETVKLLPLVN